MFDITPYQFIEWKRCEFVCGDYVSLVLKDTFGVELSPVVHEGGPLAASVALKNTEHRKLFKKIDEPVEYCVVEMQRYRSADHVGVYVIIDGKPMITHCENGSGVLLSTISEIEENYKITGFYQYVGS